MNACSELFVDLLTSKELHFSVDERDNGTTVVSFPYHGKTTKCIFDGENGEYLMMYVYYESVPENKFADVLLVCNELNAKYKWCTFYIDNEGDLMDTYNAILSKENAAEEAFELLVRMNQILDEAKPSIMRAIYA